MRLSIFLLLAWTASAHHFKGLPHFNYFENYPQVPQLEYLAQAGEHEFSLVIYDFQGINRDDASIPDDTRLYLVAYDLRESRVYSGPATLAVMDGDVLIEAREFPTAVEESIYEMHLPLAQTGDYHLTVTLGDGSVAEIPFLLSSQQINWGGWSAAVMLGLVIVVAVGSRRARVRMDRRQNVGRA
ncbi:MAG: hypothetical protein ACI8W8_004997 [Rhodothermales bacterium]|jgi:hypothetical protein